MSIDHGEPRRPRSDLFWASLMPFGMVASVLLFVVVMMNPFGDCSVRTRQNIHDPSGYEFAIEERDCSTMAGGISMAVLGAKPGEHDKTLLLDFSLNDDIPLPSVMVDPQTSTIRIAVQQVESIYSQADRWGGMDVRYEIGKGGYDSDRARESRARLREFCHAHPEIPCDPKLIQ